MNAYCTITGIHDNKAYMGYERIVSQSRRKTGPTLVIKANGKFRLSAEATTQFRDAGARRVAILWDKQKRKLALQVASNDDRSAFSLSYSKNQNSADIGAKAFVTGIGWPADGKNIDVLLEWNDNDKMFEGKVPK